MFEYVSRYDRLKAGEEYFSVNNEHWVTIKGNHILLKDGENPRSAIERIYGRYNGSISGMKQGKPMDFPTAMKGVNPNYKKGGIYMFSYYPYSDVAKGHEIITFKNPKGDLIYYDPQNEQFYDKDLPENIAYYVWSEKYKRFEHNPPQVLRIDDKDLDMKVFERFATKSKRKN